MSMPTPVCNDVVVLPGARSMKPSDCLKVLIIFANLFERRFVLTADFIDNLTISVLAFFGVISLAFLGTGGPFAALRSFGSR
jgi:hypothetical protein